MDMGMASSMVMGSQATASLDMDNQGMDNQAMGIRSLVTDNRDMVNQDMGITVKEVTEVMEATAIID